MYNVFMKRIFPFSVILLLVLLISSGFYSIVHAADIRSNNDLYIFNKSIQVETPVTNDLVAAGGDIVVDNNVSGNIMAAGGNLRINGNTEGSVRVAGGNIVIEGNIGRDLVIAGGSVNITETATIGGDLLFTGGELTMEGTVNGKAMINGGQARIEGTVNKQVEGSLGKLALGSQSVIGGDLRYSSPEKAIIEEGAVIRGTQQYTPVERPKSNAEQFGGFISAFSFYKLITDIILSLAFIYFFGAFLRRCLTSIGVSPFRNAAYGLAFLILIPLVSVFLFILIWLGIASFLFYILVLIISVFVAKVFLGWFLVRWWYRRSKKEYVLDWRAGVIGPIALFLIILIPLIGWLFIAILYLISIGAVIRELAIVAQTQQISRKKK